MVDEAMWNEAYPWAEVGSENYEKYMEVQAREPGHSASASAEASFWRDRVRADIRSSLYGGPGAPVPGLAEYIADREDGDGRTFSQWRDDHGGLKAFTDFDEYQASGATETYAEWLLWPLLGD